MPAGRMALAAALVAAASMGTAACDKEKTEPVEVAAGEAARKAGEAAAAAGEAAKVAAKAAAEQAAEAGEKAAEKAAEVAAEAREVGEKAVEKAAEVAGEAKEAAGEAGERAEAVAAAAAEGAKAVAAAAAGELGKAGIDKAAPDFTLRDTAGTPVTLSSFKGKRVVLEWFNPDCPFVVYAHTEGPLADLASKHATEGVVWLGVNSGAPGKQGAGSERNAKAREDWKLAHPVLLDEDGKVGRAYGATNTPQMVVIDEGGVVRYQGAIDNAPFGRREGEYTQYVTAALADLAAGRGVQIKQTKPYGCSVKYAN